VHIYVLQSAHGGAGHQQLHSISRAARDSFRAHPDHSRAMETSVICVSESEDELDELDDDEATVLAASHASLNSRRPRNGSEEAASSLVLDGGGTGHADGAGSAGGPAGEIGKVDDADAAERIRARVRELDNELQDLGETIAALTSRQSLLSRERAQLTGK
jgi:hypothetical protein